MQKNRANSYESATGIRTFYLHTQRLRQNIRIVDSSPQIATVKRMLFELPGERSHGCLRRNPLSCLQHPAKDYHTSSNLVMRASIISNYYIRLYSICQDITDIFYQNSAFYAEMCSL
jgi:hypothetical protein